MFLPGAFDGKRVAVGVHFHKFSGGNQAVEPVVEFVALLPAQAEFPRQLLVSGRAFGLLADLFQDGRVREHGRKAFKKLSHKRKPAFSTGRRAGGGVTGEKSVTCVTRIAAHLRFRMVRKNAAGFTMRLEAK